jgi:hypothetical protein
MKLSPRISLGAAIVGRSRAHLTAASLLAVTLIAGASVAFGKADPPPADSTVPFMGEMLISADRLPEADTRAIAYLGSMTVTASRQVVFAGKDSLRRPAG